MILLNCIRAAGKTTTRIPFGHMGAHIHREELEHLLWSSFLLIYSHALQMSTEVLILCISPLKFFSAETGLQEEKESNS